MRTLGLILLCQMLGCAGMFGLLGHAPLPGDTATAWAMTGHIASGVAIIAMQVYGIVSRR